MGPILFVLATDSISTCCANSEVFVMQMTSPLSIFFQKESENNLQLEWTSLEDWSNAHSLPLNSSKCAVMDIVTKRSLCLNDIMTNEGHSLPAVSSLPLIGVILYNNFKWNVPIHNIVKKASRRIFIIRNLKKARCSPSLGHQSCFRLTWPLSALFFFIVFLYFATFHPIFSLE